MHIFMVSLVLAAHLMTLYAQGDSDIILFHIYAR